MRTVFVHVLAVMVGVSGCSDDTSAPPDAGIPDAAMPVDGGPLVDAAQGPDAAPPVGLGATIVFPPRVAQTTAATMLVRGTATNDVADVFVNGVMATMDGTDWQVDLPLNVGENRAVVEVRDSAGAALNDVAQVDIVRWIALDQPRDVVVDSAERLGYVVDGGKNAIISMHLDNGLTREVSGPGTGTGPALLGPRSLVLDSTATRLYVLDAGTRNLVGIDVVSGDRVVLSGPGVGTGPLWNDPFAVTLNPGNGHVLLIDRDIPALFEVDSATGARIIRSSNGLGSGPFFNDPRDVAFDTSTGMAVVVNRASGDVLGVSLATGDRTAIVSLPAYTAPSWVHAGVNPGDILVVEALGSVLRHINPLTGDNEIVASSYVDFGVSYGTGILYGDINAVAVDAANGHAVVADDWRNMLIDTDINTGYSQPPWYGAGGPMLVNPRVVALDPVNGRILVADEAMDSVVSVDTATAAHTVLAGPASDQSLKFRSPLAMRVSQSGQSVFLADALDWDVDDWDTHIIEIDLQTGARTVVTERFYGAGPRPKELMDFLLEEAADRMWVAQNGGVYKCERETGILDVTLSTGDRSWLTANDDCGAWSVGAGYATKFIGGLVPGLDSQTLWALDYDGIVAVDKTTGARSLVFDLIAAGLGPPIQGWSMALDSAGDRLLVVARQELIAVDRTTGQRTLLSGLTLGSGPDIPTAWGEVILDAAPDIALVVSRGLNGVLMIDTVTGERAQLGYSSTP